MTFEKRTWIVLDIIVLALVLLSMRLFYWQIVRGDNLLPVGFAQQASGGHATPVPEEQDLKGVLRGDQSLENLQELPQPVIQRVTDLLDTITRGSIYDRNGRLLASDRLDAQGNRRRFYSEPTLAHVIGYGSGLRIGISGLEKTYNQALLGLDRPDADFNRMLHEPVTGSDLVLTIDSSLQRAAEAALEGRAGSITVIDAHSGAVLAMASLPRFDPNRVLEKAISPGWSKAAMGLRSAAAPCSTAPPRLYTRPVLPGKLSP